MADKLESRLQGGINFVVHDINRRKTKRGSKYLNYCTLETKLSQHRLHVTPHSDEIYIDNIITQKLHLHIATSMDVTFSMEIKTLYY